MCNGSSATLEVKGFCTGENFLRMRKKKKFWLAPAFLTIKLSKATDRGFGNSDEDINKKLAFALKVCIII